MQALTPVLTYLIAALYTSTKEQIMLNACKTGIHTGIALALLSTLLPAAVAQTTTSAQPSYTFHNIGSVNGDSTNGSGVNNIGQVAGSLFGSAQSVFLTDANGGALRDLGRLGGSYCEGLGVNNAGQVVGTGAISSGSSHAFLSSPNGGMLHDLGTLGGSYSSGYGVNNSGQVTGNAAINAHGDSHAFLSAANGGPLRDLGTLGGPYPSSAGNGVNDKGQVTGETSTSDSSIHAFLSDANGGVLHDLGSLGGGQSEGYGVNNSGQVAGDSTLTPSNPYTRHAFLSDANGGALHDLGTLSGTFGSSARGINNAGQVVGESSASDYSYHAFLFTNGQMLDLNTLITNRTDGLVLTEASSISDTGFITGEAYDAAAGKSFAFLLTPNLPALSATAAASAAQNGSRQLRISVSNNGTAGANAVRILSVTLAGAAASSVLPTAPTPLLPSQALTAFVSVPTAATGRAVLRVSGDYTNPATGKTGQFSTSLRLMLP